MTTGYRTPQGLRTVAFALAGILVVAAIAFGSVHLLDSFTQHDDERTLSFPAVDRLEVDVHRGDVQIVATDADRVRVRTTAHGGILSPDTEEELEDGVLRLDGGCDVFLILSCDVNYRIEVPARTEVRLKVGAGDTLVRGVRGELDLQAGVGNVEVSGPGGDRVDLTTGVGDIDARLSLAPTDFRAQTGVGTVEVLVPGRTYRVDAGTGVGETSVRVRRDDASPRRIKAKSGVGDVTVAPLPRR